MSPNDQRHEKFGYNWTKNKALLRMVPGVEVWEDLHPAGSILKIYNAQVGSNNILMFSLRFKVRMAKSTVSWDVMLFSLLEDYQYFIGVHCFHLQFQRISQSSRYCFLLAWLTLALKMGTVYSSKISMRLHGVVS